MDFKGNPKGKPPTLGFPNLIVRQTQVDGSWRCLRPRGGAGLGAAPGEAPLGSLGSASYGLVIVLSCCPVLACFKGRRKESHHFGGGSPKRHIHGCGSKNRYQNGILASGNMDQNLRNPFCLILSHTHTYTHIQTYMLSLGWLKHHLSGRFGELFG